MLDDVLITHELSRRAAPPRDLASENAAFIALARQMAVDSSGLLRCLVDLAISLCGAGSAGVSLLERGVSGPGVFRWVSLGGEYAPYVGGTTDADFSPCGVCLQRNAPQLYAAPARYFTYLAAATPAIMEGLVVPLRADSGAIGTLWIVSHDDGRFTPRDVTVMTGLADFTSAALTLQRARTRAEELSRMKDEFLSMVSHELRAPLNSILGWSELLLSGITTPERAARAIEAIHTNAARQAVLIEDLLDTSRIVAGTLRLANAPVDLAQVARFALSAVEAAAAESEIVLRSEIDGALPLFDGDAGRLQQIVGNLVNNAVKFTPASGVVTLAVRQTREGIMLSVTDTGVGMSQDQLAFVFEPFRQVDTSTTRRQAGLGLGLTIARRLAELHGGTLTAESAGLGKGSTFVLRLPAARILATRAPATQPAQRFGVAAASLAGLRILVVDDDVDQRDLVACALAHAGASIVTAGSAREALANLSDPPLDVLVSDLAMPDEDGWSLIARIRAGSVMPGLPAIAVSAYGAEADRRKALAAGFDRHVTKPVDLVAFSHLILEMTAERSVA